MQSAASTRVSIVGAGLAGTLMSIFMARRGLAVDLYERLPDLRREAIPAGRSINLALAARGIHALELAGVMDRVRPLLIPMPGRMLHDPTGGLTFIPYGQLEHETIYSVSRPGLNRVLLDAAERVGVDTRFRQTALRADFARQCIVMQDGAAEAGYELPLDRVIGADGAGSPLRRSLAADMNVRCTEEMLAHGYKELTLHADTQGRHRIATNALHIWPRGGFMLIALPNLDGTFTVTLFLALKGRDSFESLDTSAAIDSFFATHFPDAHALMPDVSEQFLANPTGWMGTIRCERWSAGDRLMLIGDAAHAITPFHGQGMNCAFEDCVELDRCLRQHDDWGSAFAMYELGRHADTNAIADMAIENYAEMRDTVRDPKFQLQKQLSLELERRHPDRFVPRYSMVMFHHDIRYATAFERGRVQSKILDELTRTASTLEQVDYTAASSLIQHRLSPLPTR
jgi:kynurenine 3-monooxygenase